MDFLHRPMTWTVSGFFSTDATIAFQLYEWIGDLPFEVEHIWRYVDFCFSIYYAIDELGRFLDQQATFFKHEVGVHLVSLCRPWNANVSREYDMLTDLYSVITFTSADPTLSFMLPFSHLKAFQSYGVEARTV